MRAGNRLHRPRAQEPYLRTFTPRLLDATLLSALLALLALGLPGCTEEGCDLLSISEEGPGDTEGYYPLAVGDRWSYQEEGRLLASTGTGPYVLDVEVTGEETADGGPVSVIASRQSNLADPRPTEWLRNGPSGVSMHATGLETRAQQEALPRLLLRWPLTSGDSYTVARCHTAPRWTVTVTVGADEQVTVPAGTFTARKVSTRYTSDAVVTDEDSWYAPGVGRIKTSSFTSGPSKPWIFESALASHEQRPLTR